MRFWALALAGLTVLRLLLATNLPLSPDEAYYWIWSVHLQPGYFDHPPMVAVWIRLGTMLLGNGPAGVRLMGPLAAAGGSLLLWRAGEDFFPGRQAGVVAAGLFNATLILGVGAVVMTPDTPLVFFWIAALAALGRLLVTRDGRWWLAVGAAAGAALLSKYTGLLLVAGIFLWLLGSAEGRAALRGAWPWAGLGMAVLVFAPDIYWNAAHGWVSFRKQGGRVAGFDIGRSAQFCGELAVGQIGLVTPLVAGLAARGVWGLRRAGAAEGRLVLWLSLLPAAVFVEHCLSGRVEPNWPAVMLPAAFLAAASLRQAIMTRWLRPALALGFAMTALVYAQALATPFPLPARLDPVALQFAGWPAMASQVAAVRPAFVTSDEYAVLSELAYDMPASIPAAGFDRRWRYFGLPPAGLPPTRLRPAGLPQAGFGPVAVGIMVTRRTDTPCPDQIGTVTRRRGNAAVTSYKLCRFAAVPGMVLLPRP